MPPKLSDERAQAKMNKGEMITTQEARVRTWLGYSLMAAFVALSFFSNLPDDQHSALGAVLAGSGVMLYQMGRDSQ